MPLPSTCCSASQPATRGKGLSERLSEGKQIDEDKVEHNYDKELSNRLNIKLNNSSKKVVKNESENVKITAAAVPMLLGITASHEGEGVSESFTGVKQIDDDKCQPCDCMLGKKLELREHIEKHAGAKSHDCIFCENKHKN
jgi:hypothetical protein